MPFKVTFTVATEPQARELEAAWHKITAGKRFPHMEVLEERTEAIMERARTALERIETAIREHPTTAATSPSISPIFGRSTPSSPTPASITSTMTGSTNARCTITSRAATGNCTSG